MIYPTVRTTNGTSLSASLRRGGILTPYLAVSQYMTMGIASKKIHQKFAKKSCRLLTGSISPPTVTWSPLIAGLRSNVSTLDPYVFMMNRLMNRCALNLTFCALTGWQTPRSLFVLLSTEGA